MKNYRNYWSSKAEDYRQTQENSTGDSLTQGLKNNAVKEFSKRLKASVVAIGRHFEVSQ